MDLALANAIAVRILRGAGASDHHLGFYSKDEDGTIEVVPYITNLLKVLAEADEPTVHARLAFSVAISVVVGDQPAIVVRYSCIDEPHETAFTPEGRAWRPHESLEPQVAVQVSGRTLLRIAKAALS